MTSKWVQNTQKLKVNHSKDITIENKWENTESNGYIIHYRNTKMHYVDYFPSTSKTSTRKAKEILGIGDDKEEVINVDKENGIRISRTEDKNIAEKQAEEYMKRNPNGEEDYRFVYNNTIDNEKSK